MSRSTSNPDKVKTERAVDHAMVTLDRVTKVLYCCASTKTGTPLRIPVQADHRFRWKPISDSGPSRSLIPVQPDHRFRYQADHFSAATGIGR